MKTTHTTWKKWAAFTLCACIASTSFGQKHIEGTWVEPIPGMANNYQGFCLESGGKATSVNMATLRYEHWEQKGRNLILSGKSIGNHQTLPFADTLTVEKLTADSLVLKKGKLTFKYARQCAKADNKCIPAAKLTPAKTASASVKKD